MKLNRRGFFATLGAALAGSQVKVPQAQKLPNIDDVIKIYTSSITVDDIRLARRMMFGREVKGDFLMIVHPKWIEEYAKETTGLR